jgi:hypothetical protein
LLIQKNRAEGKAEITNPHYFRFSLALSFRYFFMLLNVFDFLCVTLRLAQLIFN